ncbi:DUF4097 family beta strand repeat-containing protein [Agilicoccus flavus]|uniref:DUF4097 family beta strand repeat-containing protein n=1 Tax=Agilicoccus flavus TaxID=2775968 RepID=UPI001CF630FC|nr:DUF4097 family beta strand repeat-containing protein [Agilicoccus flavus]
MTTSRHDATVAAGVERIEIRTGDRDLTVRPQANANAVRVAMRGPRSECTARSWREDATLVVDTSCTAPLSRAAEVTIPPGSNVDVVAASGDVEMGGGWYNSVRVTSQDDVDLDGVGGNVAVTTSGDVRGRSAGADVAVTAGGDVRLDLSDPSSALRSADVRTTDGDVDLELPRAPSYRIDVQTSGENDVDVQDDPKAQGVVRVRSQSGDVDIEH